MNPEQRKLADKIVTVLASYKVEVKVIGALQGPTVTLFKVQLGDGVRVSRVTKLEPELNYALAKEVRVAQPIPGQVAIGVEVANSTREVVSFRDSLVGADDHPLTVAIGKTATGDPLSINLGKTPHLLIAGTTGSGKSVVLDAIMASLVERNTPEQVKLVLIDPKRVEMAAYSHVGHLLRPVVTDPADAITALSALVREMERRYDLLEDFGEKNIGAYNAEHPPIPYIVCVIDELADLMMLAKKEIEGSIVRIAQMARAVGIHLVVATQRPTVDVVTGLIKANIPSRIALNVQSATDSRVILGQGGAERLQGKGDMLMLLTGESEPQRAQGCYLSEEERDAIVAKAYVEARPQEVYVAPVEADKSRFWIAAGVGLLAVGWVVETYGLLPP